MRVKAFLNALVGTLIAVAMVLLMSESECLITLIGTKVVAVIALLTANHLYKVYNLEVK